MQQVTAKEFSTAISAAIMDKGATGIQHVLTQYMFGEKKFLSGLFFNVTDDLKRMDIVNQVINEIKQAYKTGGDRNLITVVEQLIEKSACKKNGFETL